MEVWNLEFEKNWRSYLLQVPFFQGQPHFMPMQYSSPNYWSNVMLLIAFAPPRDSGTSLFFQKWDIKRLDFCFWLWKSNYNEPLFHAYTTIKLQKIYIIIIYKCWEKGSTELHCDAWEKLSKQGEVHNHPLALGALCRLQCRAQNPKQSKTTLQNWGDKDQFGIPELTGIYEGEVPDKRELGKEEALEIHIEDSLSHWPNTKHLHSQHYSIHNVQDKVNNC